MAQNDKRGRLILLFLLFILTGCTFSPRGEVVEEFGGGSRTEAASKKESQNETKEQTGDSKKLIWVHVCGEVKKPGVYSLKAGSRVFDAVDAAGGFTKDADGESLNLAAVLEDECRIQVLSKKEKKKEEAVSEEETDKKVNLNTATREELMTLPGIGEKRAEAILNLREQKGTFSKIEDLLEVEGIKEGIFNKIKDLIKV